MRKIVTTICALALAVLFPLAWMISSGLPADTSAHVAEKYAGWNGVLRGWVCCEWKPGGSFISWLNRCSASFEKAHEGVYIEFTPVDVSAVRSLPDSGIPAPDMIFFSPGIPGSAAMLDDAYAPSAVRSELMNCARGKAVPVAMGGYILVYNRALSSGAPDPLLMTPQDDAGHRYSAALRELMNNPSDAEKGEAPGSGLDLGLPASAAAKADVMDLFINGELPMTICTQAELSRLNRLSESGRGPDWACTVSGEYAWADQLLLAGVLRQNEDERRALAGQFIQELLTEEAQQALGSIGAFSVTGQTVHSGFSPYADLEALLNSRGLVVPDCFSE